MDETFLRMRLLQYFLAFLQQQALQMSSLIPAERLCPGTQLRFMRTQVKRLRTLIEDIDAVVSLSIVLAIILQSAAIAFREQVSLRETDLISLSRSPD